MEIWVLLIGFEYSKGDEDNKIKLFESFGCDYVR
jgi:hypothetical protein